MLTEPQAKAKQHAEASDADNKSALAFYDSVPENNSIEILQNFFGKRELEPFDNSEILRSRLFYQVKSSKIDGCTDIRDIRSKKLIGTVPTLQLRHAWRMAHSKHAQNAVKNKLFFMTEKEWESDYKTLQQYLTKKLALENDRQIFFSDVWNLSEIEYESVGLKRPTQFMALLQTAILGEIEENRKLSASWERIKHYIHTVPLERSKGGIFSESDALRLKNALNIRSLNQLRRISIYKLKCTMLDYDFSGIVADINRAYKEDRARRIDYRYKVQPFIFALLNLSLVLFFGFRFKYTLIKNQRVTLIVMGLLTLFVVDAIFVYLGGLRCKRRRRKRPDYTYYTKSVKRAIVTFSFFALFTVVSIFVFYQRYDGYNNIVYYRNLKDGTVAVAGLFDETATNINIGQTIDGKVVSEIDKRAFMDRDIQHIVLPNTLEKIDKAAFKNCTKLNGITIPEGVTSIKKDAFKGCRNLAGTVTLPSTLESIEKTAFANCNLSTLVFSENAAVSIGKSAFQGCSQLKTIKNPSAILQIGDKAFKDCTSLQSLTFTDGLSSIGKEAFMNCESMIGIIVPETTKSIGKKAFYGCDLLRNVTLPFPGTSLKSSAKKSISSILDPSEPIRLTICSSNPIYAKALKGISFIESITLDDRISEIETGAFSKMKNLSTIKLPSSLVEISDSFFDGCTSLQTVIGMDSIKTVGDSAFENCAMLNAIDLSAVKTIGDSAFASCVSLTGVQLDSAKTIGNSAFRNCTELSSVSGISTLESIGDYAFDGCSRLYSLAEFTSLKSLGKYAFQNCIALEQSVGFTSALTSIESYAFRGCYSLLGADLQNASLKTTGIYIFDGCHSLSEVLLPATLEAIAEGTFSNCYSMNSIESIPNFNELSALKRIEKRAFLESGLMGEIIFPEGLTKIGERAFSHSGISSISLPSSLETIENGAFSDCNELRQATLPFLGDVRETKQKGYAWVFGSSNVPYVTLTDVFRITSKTFAGGENKLKTVTLPATVTEIGDDAFANFTELVSVELPKQLEHIGESAFENCNYLRNITLPEGLREIEKNAFRDCNNLTSIVLPESLTALGEGAFRNCSTLTGINLPKSIKEIPKNAFKDCSNLRDVSFAESAITHIGASAFEGTSIISLGTITFGDSLVKIDEMAFANWEYYQGTPVFIFSESMTEVDRKAFGSNPTIQIIVPNKDLETKYVSRFESFANVSVSIVEE